MLAHATVDALASGEGATPRDASRIDAAVRDAAVCDAGVLDAGVLDAGVLDAGVLDAGRIDALLVRCRELMELLHDVGEQHAISLARAAEVEPALVDAGLRAVDDALASACAQVVEMRAAMELHEGDGAHRALRDAIVALAGLLARVLDGRARAERALDEDLAAMLDEEAAAWRATALEVGGGQRSGTARSGTARPR